MPLEIAEAPSNFVQIWPYTQSYLTHSSLAVLVRSHPRSPDTCNHLFSATMHEHQQSKGNKKRAKLGYRRRPSACGETSSAQHSLLDCYHHKVNTDISQCTAATVRSAVSSVKARANASTAAGWARHAFSRQWLTRPRRKLNLRRRAINRLRRFSRKSLQAAPIVWTRRYGKRESCPRGRRIRPLSKTWAI